MTEPPYARGSPARDRVRDMETDDEAATMKAAMLDDGHVIVRDIPTPTPGYEEALVRLTTAGVCHSDLHIARREWTGARTSGQLGHEGIGIVEALGPGAERFTSVGDRVIVGLGGSGGGYWCGACEYCLGGRPRLCAQSKGIMGAYAEYIAVWAKSLVKLPDSVHDHDVPLACAGLTAYGAVKKLVKFDVLPGSQIVTVVNRRLTLLVGPGPTKTDCTFGPENDAGGS